MSFYLGKNILIQLLKKLRPELQRSESSNLALIVVPYNIDPYNALIAPDFDYCCEVWDTIGIGLS